MKMMMLAITQVMWHTPCIDVPGNLFRKMKAPDLEVTHGPPDKLKTNKEMFILAENLILPLCFNFC